VGGDIFFKIIISPTETVFFLKARGCSTAGQGSVPPTKLGSVDRGSDVLHLCLD
jgi:hypothetical protein